MCQTRSEARHMAMPGCGCGCGCGPLFRCFYSSEETHERLERYRNQLEKELSGVEERIKELEGK